MPTARATRVSESPRLARNRRKCPPIAAALPSAEGGIRPSLFNNCTIAAAFMPRALRRNRARFSSFKSSAEYSRYRPEDRCGRVSPSFSHARITDGETPTRRATSPIFIYAADALEFFDNKTIPRTIPEKEMIPERQKNYNDKQPNLAIRLSIRLFNRQDTFFLLDSPRLPSLTLRDYSNVVAGHKLSFSNQKFSR